MTLIRRIIFWWRMRQLDRMQTVVYTWRRPAKRRARRERYKLFKRFTRGWRRYGG